MYLEPRNKKGQFVSGERPTRRTGKKIICERCGTEVYKAKSHLTKGQRHFCSLKCWNAQQFDDSERLAIRVCPTCGTNFRSVRWHNTDKFTRYCSLVCWRIDKGYGPKKGQYRKCKYCGRKMWVQQSLLKRKYFCSKDCVGAYKTAENTFSEHCVNCHKSLQINKFKAIRNQFGYFCNIRCRSEYFVHWNSPSFQGGWYLNAKGHYFIWVGRNPKTKCRLVYRLRHRVQVELYLNKILRPTWGVLHLNGDIQDDRPENLYLCESISTLKKMQNGSIPFPAKTNLSEYRNTLHSAPITYERFDANIIKKHLASSYKPLPPRPKSGRE
jgi:endogenous inhibitor of DNA gyrase (YacG/DUF329 family)